MDISIHDHFSLNSLNTHLLSKSPLLAALMAVGQAEVMTIEARGASPCSASDAATGKSLTCFLGMMRDNFNP